MLRAIAFSVRVHEKFLMVNGMIDQKGINSCVFLSQGNVALDVWVVSWFESCCGQSSVFKLEGKLEGRTHTP